MSRKKEAKDRKRPTLGLIMGYIGNSYSSPVWRGVCDAAEDLDANLICFTTNMTDLRPTTGAESDPILDLLDLMAADHLDGLIFVPTAYTFVGGDPEILQELYDKYDSIPRMCIGESPVSMPAVKTDIADSTRKLLDHLIDEHGYRRIALIPGDKFEEHNAQRLTVYREVMAAHDMPVDDDLITAGCKSSAGARERINDLIERRIEIDAIVMPGDSIARKGIDTLLSAGVAIPEDVAVVGCNNQADSWQRPYALTTIRLPLYQLGRAATEMMLAHIENGKELTDTVIPSEIIIRRSCGCPGPAPDVMLAEEELRNVPFVENPELGADPAILRIAEDISAASHLPKEQVLGAVGAIEKAFRDDMAGSTTTFVRLLRRLMASAAEIGSDTGAWHRLVMATYHHILMNVSPKQADRAAELIQESRPSLERSSRFGARSRIVCGSPNIVWHKSVAFLSNLLAGSMRTSSHAVDLLHACGIDTFYAGYWCPLSEEPRSFRMLMNWDVESDSRCWNPITWDPVEFFTNHVFKRDTRYTMMAMHAFFNEPNGVLVFEKSVGIGYVYEWLRMAFNAAIRMILTIEKIGDQASQLALANAQLKAEVEERKQAADSLTREQNLLNTLISNIPDHIYVKDRDGRFLLVNPSVAAKLDTSIENVIGKTDYDFQPKEMADAYRSQEEALFETGQPIINFEERPDHLRCISGWKLITKVPFRDADGNMAGLVGINRDITEIRAAEQALRNKEEELRQAQKMEAIGRLSGGIAHDFNNILTVIFGYCDAAMVKAKDGKDCLHELKAIMRAAEQAKDFTSHLLAFSRKQFLSLSAVDLNGVIDGMRSMLTSMIGEDIELNIQLAPELYNVKGDEAQLEQVIMHLAANAREAMPNGGRLSILTEIVEITDSDPLMHSELGLGQCVLLSVMDTGCGMDEETQSRVFEPFFTTKDHGKATGIGLSTSYGIIKQCDGHITVKSTEGEGTTFQVYLPLLPTVAGAPGATPTTPREGPTTVLVAEDNEAVLRVITWALEREGYTVVGTRTGSEALAKYRKRPDEIDLVLADVVMPHMGGIELMEQIRQIRPDAKLLYISGYLHRQEIENAIARSGIPALQKPFAPQTLVDKVRATIDA